MNRYFFLAMLFVLLASEAQAQKSNDNITETVKSFPYQKRADADAALTNMKAWDKSSWKKFMKLFDDDSMKVKASYALNAYVNAAALEASKRQPTIDMLKNYLASAKKE